METYTPPAGYHLHEPDKALPCSNCFGQENVRHVEFPAAFDGPVVNQMAVVFEQGVDAVSIDDLILCENCLKVAAKIIGFVYAPDLVDELKRTRETLAITQEELRQSNAALGDMHQAQRSLVERRAGPRTRPENIPDPAGIGSKSAPA